MELDKMIEGLNRKWNTPNIGASNFQDINLSEEERTFIDTYSPEKSLIVYGTLAPNAPNHKVVEHIKGSWQPGIVRGSLEKLGWGAELGYYGFKPTAKNKQAEIKAFVLFSEDLVANWQMLDDFEGDGYRRILAVYELENGQIGVGYIYAIKEA
jgi:gamma-glutamylcyclotransferase (GGCT)/AIG2-like uncharacterized protein YtfP